MAVAAKIQYNPKFVVDIKQLHGFHLRWVPNEYADQPSRDSAYDILENDWAISHGMNLLSVMVAGETVYCRSKNPIYEFFSNKSLTYIRDFTHARKSMIQKGALFGLGVQRKHYKKVRFKEFPGLEWIVVDFIQEVDRRFLRIERDENKRNYWTIWDEYHDQYIVIEDANKCPSYAGPLIQDFLFYIQE